MQNMLKYYHLQHRLSLLHQRCSIFLLKIQRNTKIRKENLPTLNSLRIEIENFKKTKRASCKFMECELVLTDMKTHESQSRSTANHNNSYPQLLMQLFTSPDCYEPRHCPVSGVRMPTVRCPGDGQTPGRRLRLRHLVSARLCPLPARPQQVTGHTSHHMSI